MQELIMVPWEYSISTREAELEGASNLTKLPGCTPMSGACYSSKPGRALCVQANNPVFTGLT